MWRRRESALWRHLTFQLFLTHTHTHTQFFLKHMLTTLFSAIHTHTHSRYHSVAVFLIMCKNEWNVDFSWLAFSLPWNKLSDSVCVCFSCDILSFSLTFFFIYCFFLSSFTGRLLNVIPTSNAHVNTPLTRVCMCVCMSLCSNWARASEVSWKSDDYEWGRHYPTSWLDCWLDNSRQEVFHRSQHKHYSLEPPTGEGGASTRLGEGGVSRVWSVLCWPHQQTGPVQTSLRTQVRE